MTEKEKAIIKKLQAIIKNTPYEGEKKSALNVLKNYCLKHNIDEKDLDVDNMEIKKFTYKINGNVMSKDKGDWNIFYCVAEHFFHRQGKDFLKMGFTFQEINKKSMYLFMSLTPSEFVNLISEYEFYLREYKHAYKKAFNDFNITFLRAFLMQQNLLIDFGNDSGVLTDEELEREKEVIRQSHKIKKVQYFNQLTCERRKEIK